MYGSTLILASGQIVVLTDFRGPGFWRATILWAAPDSPYQPGGDIQITDRDVSQARTVHFTEAVLAAMSVSATKSVTSGLVVVGAVFKHFDEYDVFTRWKITRINGTAVEAEQLDSAAEPAPVRVFPWHEAQAALLLARFSDRTRQGATS